MPTRVVPVKLTSSESDLLDWLMIRLCKDSRSQVLREVFIAEAQRSGAAPGQLRMVADERDAHPPRRSKAVTRRHGPKERRRRLDNGAA